jgi:hypothetical protein
MPRIGRLPQFTRTESVDLHEVSHAGEVDLSRTGIGDHVLLQFGVPARASITVVT